MEKMKAKTIRNILYFLLGLAIVILLYEIVSFSTGRTFLPEFFSCVWEMFHLLSLSTTWVELSYSFLRLLISLSISGILGILLGILAGYFEALGKVLSPLITTLRSLPTIAVIFILAVYVPHFSLYVTFLVLFPILYQAAKEGSSEVYRKYEYDLLLKGKWHFSNLTKVILPLSSDYLLLGLIQAFGLGIKVEIMSETFAFHSDYLGIGKDIYLAYTQIDYSSVIAYVLIVLLFSLLIDLILVFLQSHLEKKLGISKEKRRKMFF